MSNNGRVGVWVLVIALILGIGVGALFHFGTAYVADSVRNDLEKSVKVELADMGLDFSAESSTLTYGYSSAAVVFRGVSITHKLRGWIGAAERLTVRRPMWELAGYSLGLKSIEGTTKRIIVEDCRVYRGERDLNIFVKKAEVEARIRREGKKAHIAGHTLLSSDQKFYVTLDGLQADVQSLVGSSLEGTSGQTRGLVAEKLVLSVVYTASDRRMVWRTAEFKSPNATGAFQGVAVYAPQAGSFAGPADIKGECSFSFSPGQFEWRGSDFDSFRFSSLKFETKLSGGVNEEGEWDRVLPSGSVTLHLGDFRHSLNPGPSNTKHGAVNHLDELSVSYSYDGKRARIGADCSGWLTKDTAGSVESKCRKCVFNYEGEVDRDAPKKDGVELFRKGLHECSGGCEACETHMPELHALLGLTAEQQSRLSRVDRTEMKGSYNAATTDLNLSFGGSGPMADAKFQGRFQLGQDFARHHKALPKEISANGEISIRPEGIRIGNPAAGGLFSFNQAELKLDLDVKSDGKSRFLPESADARLRFSIDGFKGTFVGQLKADLLNGPMGILGLMEGDSVQIDRFRAAGDIKGNRLTIADTRLSSGFLNAQLEAEVDLDYGRFDGSLIRGSRLILSNMKPQIRAALIMMEPLIGVRFRQMGDSLIVEAAGPITGPSFR
ncbi:MAG: hypothetical protein V2B18_21905 [Pseudomonadota bacterium]